MARCVGRYWGASVLLQRAGTFDFVVGLACAVRDYVGNICLFHCNLFSSVLPRLSAFFCFPTWEWFFVCTSNISARNVYFTQRLSRNTVAVHC